MDNDLENKVLNVDFEKIKLVSYEEIMMYYKKKFDRIQNQQELKLYDLYNQIKELRKENDNLKETLKSKF